ncbi:2-oxoglutarate dehydrogenase E1 component [Aciduricibacillus chroicocephali]|uniref:2-oxoglutarate dehydrogenase E1 component n=1 Tax=Aciduricibacillus chroicocephali TaxID=3054939 RepID=A0ABY9KXU1_9BACI|nr:2-oxoglutarate dehydrogenase E1 component [Bacillaceae bacterium 44XB]
MDFTEKRQAFWGQFSQLNRGYLEEQYEHYEENPKNVEKSIRQLFDKWGPPEWFDQEELSEVTAERAPTVQKVKKLTAVIELIEAIRRYGHLEAEIYPIDFSKAGHSPLIDPKTYGLTKEDLRNMPISWLRDKYPKELQNGEDLIQYLRKCYTGKISFEYDHVNNDLERRWLLEHIESKRLKVQLTDEEKKKLLKRLEDVEGFESFLQRTFVGQKRFSIEGLEMMVPVLDHIIKLSIEDKIENILMGMAHRGRLSVLAHVLKKPIDKIFSEFNKGPNRELLPAEGTATINYGWSGDVKYHYGAQSDVKEGAGKTSLTLAHNPSHLEFVNPVVQGATRAKQDNRQRSGIPYQEMEKGFSVLIHGDAAFIGEGIVAETLNLSGLAGYRTGGTVHIIANNRIGYTTAEKDGRSTRYASDLAKGFEIPIIHVNADDPLACISAAALAFKYRRTFEKDILIDLVGYRRYGHNEIDEPRTTQPQLYAKIDKHPTVATLFSRQLIEKGILSEEGFNNMQAERNTGLRKLYDSMKENNTEDQEIGPIPPALAKELGRFKTEVPLDKLKKLNDQLAERPEGFMAFRKLEKILARRKGMLESGGKVDWGAAEALAFASILSDGTPIRLTGQDTERGTFAHRHMVLHDVETEDTYCLMHGIKDAKASFDIHNSPLSEAGVLGFEYGYSVHAPETLVIWEAQFGDFANAAQVIFDQFITSSRAKWAEKSGLVMLLPHGYEGQGPEHSSARLERYLQGAAENNLIVANVTSSAQYFHLLRRQALLCGKEEVRPLIVMTPKSLLRNPIVASDPEEFSEKTFELVKPGYQRKTSRKEAKRLLLGSGKIMIEIEEKMKKTDDDFSWLEVLRLEQFYPFPERTLGRHLAEMPNIEEIVWVQEEPRNMGAWDFVDDYLNNLLRPGQMLRYLGRPKRSSPAVGEPNLHRNGQTQIIEAAISREKRSVFL